MEGFLFVIVIVTLILVHELGHFLAAKISKMRVDEFGLGYPPHAATLGKIGETRYTLNWLPFGGFVKIYGEDAHEHGPRAFSARPRILQAFVLVAGVGMNLLFAYLLLAGALYAGTERALSPQEIPQARSVALATAHVLPGSPAEQAGLMPGDIIEKAADAKGAWTAADPKSFTEFVNASHGAPITLSVKRGAEALELSATPKRGIAPNAPERYALGVEVATIGVAPLPLLSALTEAGTLTASVVAITAEGLWHFFYGVFTFSANLSQVSGPIGIAGAVGNASSEGAGVLLSLMAIISINLALINLIPLPALDGGRLLFVLIESVIRRPISPNVAQAVNAAGFTFLVLLMVVVTAHDILRLVG